MATYTKTICDLKDCENEVNGFGKSIHFPVCFHTEQTEGRGVEAYFTNHKLDICEECLQKMLVNYPLHGSGAQGYNDYYLGNIKNKIK